MRVSLKPSAVGPVSGWRVGPVAVGRTVVERSSRWRMLIPAAAGAVAAILLDPAVGRSRRAQLASRSAGAARATGRTAARVGRATAAQAYGITQKVRHMREEPKDYDDATLAQKLRSEILRGRDTPSITIDVTDGVATLRGEVGDPRKVRSLVRAAEKTQGVRDVVNLLHAPGNDAPNKATAIRASR